MQKMSRAICLKMDINMHFDHIDYSHKYLKDILSIIMEGIGLRYNILTKNKREGLNTQSLVDAFNSIGTTLVTCNTWIGVQKEHERENSKSREDIYFYLNDDNYTRIFYVEAKRLPKYKTNSEEEYVIGHSTTGNPSGGIQRYKLNTHGDSNLRYNGMIAYVENKSVEDWLNIINCNITRHYPNDVVLTKTNQTYEYTSTHFYENKEEMFVMYHFWIDLTK